MAPLWYVRQPDQRLPTRRILSTVGLEDDCMRILLIEDDRMIARSLTIALGRDGMSVDWVSNCADGAEALAVGGHTMILLDLGLAGGSGLELLKAERSGGNLTPVIIVTARDGVDDRVAGLDLGADDYVAKPFDPRELIARMRAVWRRRSGAAVSQLEAGEVRLDLATHELRFRAQTEVLPAREFALVRTLIERPGAILSRSQIETRLYGWGTDVESNAVDVLIYSIRKKFGKDIIRNVRGAGWMVLSDRR
jgi:DNA-binding response OmpR family regulator